MSAFNLLGAIYIILFSLTLPLKVFATTFTKYNLNPILINSNTGWDSNRVWQPSVIFDSNEYKLFYSGFNGSRFQIGMATSSDGHNWVKNINNPIISRLSLDNKDAHDPTVIQKDFDYEMWYASSINGGSSNFRIQRAIKIGSNDWTSNPVEPVLSPSGTWDQDGLSSPFVINNNTEYKMWYSGFSGGKWKIGYASSIDGINWIPYNQNPIIDLSAQGFDADGATVFQNDSNYELYFHGVNGNLMYSVSNNGITNWSSPIIVLTKGENYDSGGITAASILNNQYGTKFLYYSGRSPVGTWSINLASDGSFTSPTPTQTPTPTPTPLTTTKIVVIPGMGASWNWSLLTSCSAGTGNEVWTATDDTYTRLIAMLENGGLTTKALYYDWRKPPPAVGSQLANLINRELLPNEKIHMIGHSMGGLVGRAYIEQSQQDAKVDSYLSVGSPHQGSLEAYLPWAGGETTLLKNIFHRFVLETVVHYCAIKNQVTPLQALQTYTPSLPYLLPTFDYLRDKNTKLLKPLGQMHYQNPWLPNANFSAPFYGIRVGTIIGTGEKTYSEFHTIPPNTRDINYGLWKDGNPANRITTLQGDELVLTNSANVPGADNSRIVSTSHGGLVTTNNGLEAIASFFAINPSTSLSNSLEAKSALAIIVPPGTLTTETPNGDIIPDQDGLVFITNPHSGKYRLHFGSNRQSDSYAVAQLLPNGKTLWKDYKSSNNNPHDATLIFNQEHPIEDPIQ